MPDDSSPAAQLDLGGWSVLVAGASGGIGACIAGRFVAAGAEVTASYRTPGGAVEQQPEQHGIHHVRADLTVEEEVATLVSTAAEPAGRLDAVVNATGVQTLTALQESDSAQWQAVLETNLTAAHLLTRAAATAMASGSVTHLASIEATHPATGHAHYGASKAGLLAYARAAAVEYGPRGVRVNTVSPGLVHREGIEAQWPDGVRRWEATAPLRRLGRPADIANACLFLASPLGAWITGQDIVVDGGVTAVPSW